MKTAVEWYVEQGMKLEIQRLKGEISTEKMLNLFFKKVRQAKAMEKEQIMAAFEAAEKDCGRDFLHGDLYYNETFKSK